VQLSFTGFEAIMSPPWFEELPGVSTLPSSVIIVQVWGKGWILLFENDIGRSHYPDSVGSYMEIGLRLDASRELS
jgi:hypothetical protein